MDILKTYVSKLDSKFAKNRKAALGAYIIKSKRNEIIPAGTLVVMPSNGAISLKILDKDTPDKGFSTPLKISDDGYKLGLSANYLMWYFKIDFVAERLISTAVGTVMPRIPREILEELKIPLPIHPNASVDAKQIDRIPIINSPFKKLISSFYEDYRLNFEKDRFTTSVILAGAIGEAILYQLLLDYDVDPKLLENDRTLGFGKLLAYVQILKINDLEGFPLNHFEELQKHRNSAIHVGLAVKREKQFTKENLTCFDHIVKYFGI